MSERKILKKLGIEVIEKISERKKFKIANKITILLIENFFELDLNYAEIMKKILNVPMYYANIPSGLSRVNYIQKIGKLYISKKCDKNELEEQLVHEIIHIIQEYKYKKSKTIRIGLCSINELSVTGVAMNEAAIQYIATRILNKKEKKVKVYGITIPSKTEYYPVITNLIEQIAFLVGENLIIESTIKANDEFKYKCIDSFGELGFIEIQSNFEKILKSKNNMGIENEQEKILEIQTAYENAQERIYTNYFENNLKKLKQIDEIENLMKKINNYKKINGYIENNIKYEEFAEKMNNLAEEKITEIRRKNMLMVDNRFTGIVRKIKKLFMYQNREYNK